MTHITGSSRHQTTLFPESLDELIAQDHPVRVIDAFVNSLDLGHLGFKKAIAEATGRPPCAPADLLKLYVYETSSESISTAYTCCSHLSALLPIREFPPNSLKLSCYKDCMGRVFSQLFMRRNLLSCNERRSSLTLRFVSHHTEKRFTLCSTNRRKPRHHLWLAR